MREVNSHEENGVIGRAQAFFEGGSRHRFSQADFKQQGAIGSPPPVLRKRSKINSLVGLRVDPLITQHFAFPRLRWSLKLPSSRRMGFINHDSGRERFLFRLLVSIFIVVLFVCISVGTGRGEKARERHWKTVSA